MDPVDACAFRILVRIRLDEKLPMHGLVLPPFLVALNKFMTENETVQVRYDSDAVAAPVCVLKSKECQGWRRCWFPGGEHEAQF